MKTVWGVWSHSDAAATTDNGAFDVVNYYSTYPVGVCKQKEKAGEMFNVQKVIVPDYMELADKTDDIPTITIPEVTVPALEAESTEVENG